MPNEARFVTLLGATGEVRTASEGGRDWTVVPLVSLVEGVIHAVNAPKPELVRAGLFQKALSKWEGKPIFCGHPMKDGVPIDGLLPDVLPSSFGIVRNATATDRALKMEAWLDHARCLEGTPGGRILARVRATPPKPIEVSVGAWVKTLPGEGTWSNGKRYAAEWVDWEPNHQALLDDGKRGACDVEMGCGTHRIAMRVAADGQSLEDEVEPKNLFQRVLSLFRSAMPRGWGDDEVKQELRDALLIVEPAFKNGEILRVKNDAVVYCLYPPAPMYYDTPSMPAMTYWSRAYAFDTATQKFMVDANRTQVEPTTHYEPYRAAGTVLDELEPTPKAPCACGNHAAAAAGETSMTKEERIAALVANPHSPSKDAKEFAGLSEATLTVLESMAVAMKTADEKAAKETADKKAADEKVAADLKAAAEAEAAKLKVDDKKPEPESQESFLARNPDLKAIVDGHRAAEATRKTELVTSIRAASQVYSEEDLAKMSVVELAKLAALAKVELPKVDFSGRGIPRVAASGEDLASYAPPDAYAEPKAVTH